MTGRIGAAGPSGPPALASSSDLGYGSGPPRVAGRPLAAEECVGVVQRFPALLFGLLLAFLPADRQGAARGDRDAPPWRHRPVAECWPQADPRAPPRPAAGDLARDSRSCGPATVGPERRLHILEGDARGGGHRPGRGIPNKSEFPRGWSDDRIIGTIEEVANDPEAARRLEADGRTVVTGRRHGVDIRVVIDRDGRSIVTGYPTSTPRNPR